MVTSASLSAFTAVLSGGSASETVILPWIHGRLRGVSAVKRVSELANAVGRSICNSAVGSQLLGGG